MDCSLTRASRKINEEAPINIFNKTKKFMDSVGKEITNVVSLSIKGKEEGVYSGNVIIMTNDTNPAQARVEVGYKVRILHGGISVPGGYNNFGLLGWRKEYDPSCISNPKVAEDLGTKGSVCEEDTGFREITHQFKFNSSM